MRRMVGPGGEGGGEEGQEVAGAAGRRIAPSGTGGPQEEREKKNVSSSANWEVGG
jgi:hypothetical protein